MTFKTLSQKRPVIQPAAPPVVEPPEPPTAPRDLEILETLKDSGPLTDRQIAENLLFEDMNKVRPQITRMVARGTLKLGRRIYDPATGRNVRTVEIA